ITVVSAGPWSSEKAEMNILEISENLHPQLAENKQQFRNIKEKFLVTQGNLVIVPSTCSEELQEDSAPNRTCGIYK
uniref:Uncharacterized protein n=1 Tax=Piliocolobus tephrosceles TaxID=591936 RepID=A0A8C9GN39_9PRIM